MSHSLKRNYPVGSNPAFMKAGHVRWVTSCVLAVVVVLSLLLLGHGFASEDGYDKWQAPPGQPEQMWSKVDYDPELADPFFLSDEWSCPDGCNSCANCRDGTPVQVHKVDHDPKGPDSSFELEEWSCPDGCKPCATCLDGNSVKKNTAKCFSNSLGVKHQVAFCEARLVDENIDLLIHKTSPAFHDRLRVLVRKGMFTCQFWNLYQIPGDADMVWTTKRQELTLDKKVYRKGDVIKGRIDFECVMEATNPAFIEKKGKWTMTIKVYGVFKTIVE
jgi:hypothetical protein